MKKIVKLNENDIKRIVKKVLKEQELTSKDMDSINYAVGQQQHKPEYFQKNPQGVMTLDYKLDPTSINGSKGISEEKWNSVWGFSEGGRGANPGSTGKFDYQYKDNKIHIKPSKGNNDVSYGGFSKVGKDGKVIVPPAYFELK